MKRILPQVRKWYHRIPLNRTIRTGIIGLLYLALLGTSLLLAYLLRLDFRMPPDVRISWLHSLYWVLPLKLVLLLSVGTLRAHLGFFGVLELFRLTRQLAIAAGVMLAVRLFHGGVDYAPPVGVIVIDFVLSVCMIASARLFLRLLRQMAREAELLEATQELRGKVVRVAIIGAGEAGSLLAQEFLLKPRLGMRPVAFLDDNPTKWDLEIHGIPVIGAPEVLRNGGGARLRIDRAIIAMPSASGRRMREVVELLQGESISFQTVPSMDQLSRGQVQVSRIRPVEIEDLLGRDPVRLDTTNIRNLISGGAVMVTGAGGSIGSELCHQIASHSPRKLLLVEQSEVQLFQVEQALIDAGHRESIVPLIADVTDVERMRQIFEEFRPALVFHAAAHKHVPMMEGQPGEAVKNNVFGTRTVADLAVEYGVERFVLISTDKAINPVNVMGATKRMAELYLQGLNNARRGPTRFMAVRFGNVLGSSGSVIPQFRKQIAAGGPVRVTCPEITRYFMTIPEAVGLVLQCATQGEGGEIFVLDMGEPIKIVDLAKQLIRLSGLKPGEDIEIQFTGLRPGEKCFEEINYSSEHHAPTSHPSIWRFTTSSSTTLEEMNAHIVSLRAALAEADGKRVRELLQEIIPEYRPRVATGHLPWAGISSEAWKLWGREGGGALSAGKAPFWPSERCACFRKWVGGTGESCAATCHAAAAEEEARQLAQPELKLNSAVVPVAAPGAHPNL